MKVTITITAEAPPGRTYPRVLARLTLKPINEEFVAAEELAEHITQLLLNEYEAE